MVLLRNPLDNQIGHANLSLPAIGNTPRRGCEPGSATGQRQPSKSDGCQAATRVHDLTSRFRMDRSLVLSQPGIMTVPTSTPKGPKADQVTLIDITQPAHAQIVSQVTLPGQAESSSLLAVAGTAAISRSSLAGAPAPGAPQTIQLI